MGFKSASVAMAAAGMLSTAAVQAADSCSNTMKTSYPAPVAADGWTYRLVANGFTKPRGILFDDNDALLLVDSGSGLKHLTFKDDGGDCLTLDKQTTLLDNDELNHGIALSNDNKTLYASSSDSVFSWSYDAGSAQLGDSNTTLVTNMSNSDHTTRTLWMSQKHPGTLIVSRGSDSNNDSDARQMSSGHAQIRTFNASGRSGDDKPYDFLDGDLLGWGLRNSVGVTEHPVDGGIWSVENSIDELDRDGKDIHQNNPAEEMNFHGYLNGSTEHQGGNYGYPLCFTLWSKDNFPQLGDLQTGMQFPGPDGTALSDGDCNDKYVDPRLAFQAHMAPLDIKFSADGSEAFVAFHGSWDRNDPVGYHVSSIDFSNGQPKEPSDSMTAAKDVLTTPDLSKCPDDCFRPVGLAWDSKGRLWLTSDSTGEVFVMARSSSSGGGGGGDSDNGGSGGGGGDDNDDSAAGRLGTARVGWVVALAATVVGAFML